MPHWPDCSTERPGQPRRRTTKPTTTRGEKGPGSVTGVSTTFKNRRLSAIEPEELESSIREAYFAIASWVAIRYDVEIDEVIDHLRRAGVHSAVRPGAAVHYVEDIVLAVAATQGNRQAWSDASQIFDLTLVRACSLRLPEQESVMYVRRFLADLERETLDQSILPVRSEDAVYDDEPAEGDGGLRAYAGLRPLRVWLTDRLLAQLEREVPSMRVHLAPMGEPASLRLAD
jgi:hypothetical protein